MLGSTVAINCLITAMGSPAQPAQLLESINHIARNISNHPTNQDCSQDELQSHFVQLIYSDLKSKTLNEIVTWCRDMLRWQEFAQELTTVWRDDKTMYTGNLTFLAARILAQVDEADKQTGAGVVKGNIM